VILRQRLVALGNRRIPLRKQERTGGDFAAAPSVAGHGCFVGIELTGPQPLAHGAGPRRPADAISARRASRDTGHRFWRMGAVSRQPAGAFGAEGCTESGHRQLDY
jgi:hypothetical protein